MMIRLTLTAKLVFIWMITLVAAASAAEMRGLWVDAFHPGFRNPEQTSRMIAKAKDCNFNSLFVQVRSRGCVCYTSSIEPMDAAVASGYDPLADVVAKAHAAGLKVHAWISVYDAHHDIKWRKSQAGQPHLRHPEWLMRDFDGGSKFPGDRLLLDPGLPEVQAYLASIAKEIVDRYRVDGLHLDTASYPGQESGYNEASVGRFNRETGRSGKPAVDDESWCKWRRDQVTALVRAIRDKTLVPSRWVELSVSTLPNWADTWGRRLQDWHGWLDADIVDFAVPMVFSSDPRVFEVEMKEAMAAGSERAICIGQPGWKVRTADSLKQIALVRESKACGVVIYSYAACSSAKRGETAPLMDDLRSGLFTHPQPAPVLAER